METEKGDDVVVFLTIATTGLNRNGFVPEICQITLQNQAGHRLFCKCVLPERNFQPGASLFNGFTIDTIDGKRCLLRHSKVVKSYPLDKVIDDLITEISAIRAQVSGRIVLAGYFNQKYDIPLLVSEMKRCDVSTQKLINMNVVCTDVYQVVRNNQMTLMPWHLDDLKMTTVYNVLCGDNKPHKHDALEDADKLRAIYGQICGIMETQTFETSVFSFPAEDEVGIPAMGSGQQGPRGTRAVKRQSIEGEDEQATKRPCRDI
jgi:DNA polymerase III epsilon subunit-like protein